MLHEQEERNELNCEVLFQNVVKYGKYSVANFANFLYICITTLAEIS